MCPLVDFPEEPDPHALLGFFRLKNSAAGICYQQRRRHSATMAQMPATRSSQSPAAILHRLAQLEKELEQARADLKNLRTHDPATSEVVMRGAKLSRERAGLERQLERLRQESLRPKQYSH